MAQEIINEFSESGLSEYQDYERALQKLKNALVR